MANLPLISLIIPIYNVEQYLVECLESTIAQTYKKIEIILVNDGSTDRSLEICKEYAQKDDRIKILNKENGGLSDARNYGIERAGGEYISFIDSDDFVAPYYVEALYDGIRVHDVRIAIGYVKRFDENAVRFKDISGYSIKECKAVLKSGSELLDWLYSTELEKRTISVASWNKMFHKSLWESRQFPKGRLHEDEYTIFKFYIEQKEIAMVQNDIYYYRMRSGSITNSYNSKRIQDKWDAIAYQEEYYTKMGLIDKYSNFLNIAKLKWHFNNFNLTKNKTSKAYLRKRIFSVYSNIFNRKWISFTKFMIKILIK